MDVGIESAILTGGRRHRRGSRHSGAFLVLIISITMSLSAAARAARPDASDGVAEDDLFELPIEDLVAMQVTSVAGVEQDWFETPSAITVISGLIASTALTLVVIPVLYSVADRLKQRALGRRVTAQPAARDAVLN